MADQKKAKASGLLILAIELPPEIFDMIAIQIPPNTKAGNIAVDVDATETQAVAIGMGLIISDMLNKQTQKNIKG